MRHYSRHSNIALVFSSVISSNYEVSTFYSSDYRSLFDPPSKLVSVTRLIVFCSLSRFSPYVRFIHLNTSSQGRHSSILILPVRMLHLLRWSFWVIVLRIYMAILQAVFLFTLRSRDNCKAEMLFLAFSISMTAKNHFAEANGYD